MQTRNRVINKLALVLLSLVVLELVLIGDQVQPVKAIKKKIVLKKLKKLLPLLALMKPKKKIILLPIPIPMFKKEPYPMGAHNQYEQPAAMGMGTDTAPTSFMMIGDPSGQPGVFAMEHGSMLMPMSMLPGSSGPDYSMVSSYGGQRPPTSTVGSRRPVLNGTTTIEPSQSQSPALMVPSMTMTIQSEPGGSSNIELSTNLNPMTSNGSLSGALVQLKPPAAKLRLQQQRQKPQLHQQQQQQSTHPLQQLQQTQQFEQQPQSQSQPQPQPQQNQPQGHSQQQQPQQTDQFDEPSEQVGGEYYYSSPWTAAAPSTGQVMVFRSERLRSNQQQQHRSPPAMSSAATPTPVLRTQWRPAQMSAAEPARQQQQQQTQPQVEYEEFIPVGPPRLVPIYQTASGQLRMSPPPPPPSLPESPRSSVGEQETAVESAAGEVRVTVPAPHERPSVSEHRLTSPAVKGKLQQGRLGQSSQPRRRWTSEAR